MMPNHKHTTPSTQVRLPFRPSFRLIAAGLMVSAILGAPATAAMGCKAGAPVDMTPMATNAHAVLDRHCARCHQAGKLDRQAERPRGNFGYILDLERLAKKRMVIPGNASGSPLMQAIENTSMPKDMSSDCYFEPPEDAYCGPTAEEIGALRVWIDSLGNVDTDDGRAFVTDAAIIEAIALDIAAVPEQRRQTQRYFTLTHLYNAGDSDHAMKVYRQAVVKLLNSLSRKSDPVRPVVVDEHGTVLRVDIQDLGWSGQTWTMIAEANPYLVQYDDALFQTLQQQTGTVMPMVRADWFTFVSAQPPLYYDLLGLPDTKQELERLVGVDTLANLARLDVARAGFRKSGVSTNNRLIERHDMATGAYWESFDFAGNAGVQDFFARPLGPPDAFADVPDDYHFHADGGEIIFDLPNGFHAYYLTDHLGNRLDKGPTHIVRDDSRRDAAVTNGISCMGCHDQGIKYNPYRERDMHDEIRPIVEGNFALPKIVRDMVSQIFPPHQEFAAIMERDAERYKDALGSAGVDMGLKDCGGQEMINALFARFEEDVTADLAAAEFGLRKDVLSERLSMAGGNAHTLKLRLVHDRIPRDRFVTVYADMVGKVTDNTVASLADSSHSAKGTVSQSVARPPSASKTFDLAFVPTSERFIVGDPVAFEVTAAKPCYLTLINSDDRGRAQVLYPNRFNRNNALEANRTYTIPGDHIGGFKVSFTETGTERVIAICNASRPNPRGVMHDFDNSAYTDLGDLDSFTRSRLLAVSKDTSPGTAKVASFDNAKHGHGGGAALVENLIDPEVDIVAQKAIVMKVRKH